ncbi:hypothetical protein AB0B79_26875 [Streptomyces sp. NPDC039022]|uniref:hypothetical protein n=1 Tax=Streptomyces sp. NPDC039022 TaxID=3157091 RepID=UPI0033EA9DF5
MDAHLAALATTTAQELFARSRTDRWHRSRDELTGLLARFSPGGVDREALTDELEDSREEFLTARLEGDPAAADDVEAGWRARLRRLLRASPALAGPLRDLLARWSAADDRQEGAGPPYRPGPGVRSC